jgi:ribosomal protein L37E
MYCPSCATEANDQTKYCTKCGFDLRILKGAKNDRSYDWFQEIALEDHREKRKKTPEEKRLIEIKGGVITTSVGLGVMIFLFVLFQAISNTIDGPEKEIIRAIPLVGVIPLLIGLGIIFNGLFISRKIVALKREADRTDQQPSFYSAPETAPVQRLPEEVQAQISVLSVTEPTTTRLREPISVSTRPDTD